MNSLFDGQTLPTVDENKDYFAELVGEGKKFKTEKDLARGKYEADLYIETIKRQKDELSNDYLKLRQDYDARARLEDMITKLMSDKQSTSNDTLTQDDHKPHIDEKQIESLFDSRFQERITAYERQRKEQNNLNQVKNKLRAELGPYYEQTIQRRIEDLGLTAEEADLLAKRSPDAFYRTFDVGLKQQEQFQAPPRSSQTTPFKPTGEKKRTWAYYQELKKKDPKAWLDPKTAIQMHNDQMSLGEEFRDGDFYAQ